MPEKPKNVEFANAKELIYLFLKKDIKISWPREIKIAKKLLQQYPDMSFWRGLDIEGRVITLASFLTLQYQSLIASNYKKFTVDFQRQPSYNIEDKPIVEVRKPSKPKDFFEFIDGV